MTKLSIGVLTKNEEENVAECLETLQWGDELFVLDAYSDDRTVEIAREHGAVVHQRPWTNFAAQRNLGIELASHPWLFYVDADERATPALATEVREAIDGEKAAGWWVPRQNYIFGKWIRGGGWYPDYQLRLFRRDAAHYDESRAVHELVILDGLEKHLQNTLIHHNYDTLGEFFARQDFYTGYEAQILYEQGVQARPHNFILQPLREFRRRFIALKGYQDGAHGLLLATLTAYYEWIKYVKLRRLQRQASET